ncbi:hypothetical protein HMPREF3213_02168 [Heyndrickxia coagulans]|uniref:Uncharacterized protein n=1 Tax=Heyndrickxia coagulans TaxID=1398 RepID=A0A133KNB5_HEYCO|nr:hypothetical protein HMPREF3213_02168 [Heyndrickxia coagulans]
MRSGCSRSNGCELALEKSAGRQMRETYLKPHVPGGLDVCLTCR